jgi:hypothetical protein
MDTTTAFDKRLPNVPSQWRDALVEVIDTAEAICLGLQQPVFGVINPATECPQLVAELTRLTCERYDATDARQERQQESNLRLARERHDAAFISDTASFAKLVSFSRSEINGSTTFDIVDDRGRLYWRTLSEKGCDSGWNQWSGGLGFIGDAPAPVAASERMPTKDDCNKDGFYWCSGCCEYEGNDYRFTWTLSQIEDENEFVEGKPCCTHWLPYGSLPHLSIPTRYETNVSCD